MRYYGQQLLQFEPWNEAVHRALIASLIAAGKPHAALRQFELCHKALIDHLGLEPEAETRALIEPLQVMVHEPAQRKPLRRRSTRASLKRHKQPNVERNQNRFIGRTAELLACERFLSSSTRLLSIVGPGGIGKSRLAHQVLRLAEGHFRDGVLMQKLCGNSAPDPVTGVAQALGLHAAATCTDMVAALAQRELLLLLDGFDPQRHSRNLLLALQQQAPKVKLLVTTRQPLGLAHEQSLWLKGLINDCVHASSGFERCEATQLFIARSAERGAQLDQADLKTVAQICWQLDGIPRAIELAVALTVNYSCSAIAELVLPEG
ncbi:BTAD domain-containing putative transcriptional regulator [Candidatus Viridilinea mediisalina]|uniref:Uncharacterized protein n=1 Tax=Candidatus Viridilinea mediisalina TaxID=2024553 RepID=A0A2A6RE30_9CHLR|nr:BTAD domain-containing putative transcriptional regulator [Candidatus Viridilinea mediisalina]PDW01193.1 hypothetical protein CJ255_19495 [Candidatus Viridilinea mediisalina]